MNDKLVKALIGVFAGMGGVVFGALARQPEINKLHKQVKRLQSKVDQLEAAASEQNEEIADLLVKYEALRIWQFSQRSELRDRVRESLVFQYAVADYLDLLVDCVRGGRKMDEGELGFYRAFAKTLSGKKTSDREKEQIKTYVVSRHGLQISQMRPCDTQRAFDRIREYDARSGSRKRGLPGFLPFGKGEDGDGKPPEK